MAYLKGQLKAKVLPLYDGKRGSWEIANMIGCNRTDVNQVLRRAKLKVIWAGRSDRERRAQYRACADAGMTAHECGEKLGVSIHSVRSMARVLGIKFTPKTEHLNWVRNNPPKPRVALSASPKAVAKYIKSSVT